MKEQLDQIFTSLGVEYFVIMPDSMNGKLYEYIAKNSDMNVIQGLNETDVITIASGLNLSGRLSVAVMENSGIRSVCDLLSRFEISHHIHNIFLISARGEIGEENWWGIRHQMVTSEILNCLNILNENIHTIKEFELGLSKAIKSFKTGQTSVVLNLTIDFFKNIQK